jgi:ubiquinone/menaquinone biosynthesis C-methylase UbiE
MDYTKFREAERDGWSERAAGYDGATARATLQTIPALLSHARLFPNSKVLDQGCGPGYVAACADLLGVQAKGIDFSQGMIDEARSRFPHISFEVGDIESVDEADQTYDAVLSNFVLFHVTDPVLAMREAYRVLKPSGRFVFSQWLAGDQSDCYRLMFEVLKKHADMSLADPAPDAYFLSDRRSAQAALESVGFNNIKFEVVENVLHAEAESFYDFFMTFGIRIPFILERQSRQVQETIRTEIDEWAGQYLVDGEYRIPMASIVISAMRPD